MTAVALTNPLLEEGLDESPNRYVSTQELLSGTGACSSVSEIQSKDREANTQFNNRPKKVTTHVITKPLKSPNNPAFTSQKLLTHICIPTTTAAPTPGITPTKNGTASTKGDSG